MQPTEPADILPKLPPMNLDDRHDPGTPPLGPSRAILIGWTPERIPILNHDPLPDIPFPERVIVGPESIEINGFGFLYHTISRQWLKWLKQTLVTWNQTGQIDNELLNAMVCALEDRLTKKGRWEA